MYKIGFVTTMAGLVGRCRYCGDPASERELGFAVHRVVKDLCSDTCLRCSDALDSLARRSKFREPSRYHMSGMRYRRARRKFDLSTRAVVDGFLCRFVAACAGLPQASGQSPTPGIRKMMARRDANTMKRFGSRRVDYDLIPPHWGHEGFYKPHYDRGAIHA